jgi:integrase
MKRKIPETITEEEFIKLLKAVKKNHHRIAFILGFYGCLRVSEVVNLRQQHIDRGQRLLRIKEAKGNKDRNIPIPPESVRGLSHIPVKCGVRALQIAIKHYGKLTLDKDIHFHTLRHSGATHYLIKKKWDTRYLQQLLGHASLDTTQIYTHVKPDILIDKMWGE